MINSVDVIICFIIGTREEADGAFNQGEFIAVDIPFNWTQNRISEIVNEDMVKVVSLGTVDDEESIERSNTLQFKPYLSPKIGRKYCPKIIISS